MRLDNKNKTKKIFFSFKSLHEVNKYTKKMSNLTLIDNWMNATYPLRSMFYMLTPQETYYERIEHVPKLFSKVT